MPEIPHLKTIQDFLDKFSDLRLFSTGFEVVDFRDDLYNVRGSSDDPIRGKNYSKMKPVLARQIAMLRTCLRQTPLLHILRFQPAVT